MSTAAERPDRLLPLLAMLSDGQYEQLRTLGDWHRVTGKAPASHPLGLQPDPSGAAASTSAGQVIPVTAPVRDQHGYYRMPDGRKLISVTTVIEHGIPKPELRDWTAHEVATCAMEWVTRIVRARTEQERAEVLRWLKGAANRKRDAAAQLGIAVHDHAEAHALGAPCAEPTVEQLPFIAAFARFCERWRPRWEAAEMVLAHYGHGWAGTCDAWMWLVLPDVGPDPVLVLVDYKSGSKARSEVGLQLSAYIRAEVGFLRDGTQITPPRARYAAVVHIRPGKYAGGYSVKRVDVSDETYGYFLNAQRTAEGWVRGHSKTVLQRAYREPPIPASARKAA